jgi:hypothetical protein
MEASVPPRAERFRSSKKVARLLIFVIPARAGTPMLVATSTTAHEDWLIRYGSTSSP